jgi:hypothetical protein
MEPGFRSYDAPHLVRQMLALGGGKNAILGVESGGHDYSAASISRLVP